MATSNKARKNRSAAEAPDPESALAILSSLGEVAYRWSIDDDRLYWDGDVQSVLGLPADEIATGRVYAALLDPDNTDSRHDAVFLTDAGDRGTGAPFQVEYALRPGGPDQPIVWIEDSGRWYGDGSPLPKRVVGIIRVVSDRHEREQRLTFRSSHDELTGFYNRARLIELLEDTLINTKRFRGSAGFMLIAIDSFRLINDSYGFEVGDQVLAVMAKRAASRLRGADAIGRFSGNKLGVVLRDCSDETMAVAAERFLSVAREEVITTDNGAIAVSISIGGVTLPRNASTVNEATARAEEALHQARQIGQGRFRPFVYSPDRQEERRANSALSNELIRALREDRMRLAFQPIVGISNRQPVLYECLLRLEQPDGRITEARSFMPLSERLGLSRLLDRRALELALEALEARPDIMLSVNVTAETATEAEWLACLEEAVSQNPDIARRLVVEITETTAIQNLDEASKFVSAVKKIGCTVAIDDFGAGYSSFRILRQLDIDVVKIDGDYIKNLAADEDDQTFVRTLIALAKHFRMKTVAEWIRDDKSAALLAEWGVDYLQGDLTGSPILDVSELAPVPD